ncbi:MAG: hypothetical protein H0U27_12165, partial [Nitrosopumilus sp.]|nr:hypothetical protein [Nitrosopumilus sp.]
MAHVISEKITDSVFYKAPVAFLGGCKKAFETVGGLSKVAGIALSIFTLIDLKSFGVSMETVEILADQAKSIQTVKNGTSWASITYELLTKPFNAGWIGNINRIVGLASSALRINGYLTKIKVLNFTDYLKPIGGVSINVILSSITVVLSLIENAMTFYENYNNAKKLDSKRIALIKSEDVASIESNQKLAGRANLITGKLNKSEVEDARVKMVSLKSEKDEIKVNLDLLQYDQIEKDGKSSQIFKSAQDKDHYEGLIKRQTEISLEQNKVQFVLKTADLRQKTLNLAFHRHAANTEGEVRQLSLALKLLENPDALALKEVKILNKHQGAYVEYKEAKYNIRKENLANEFKETCWGTAINVISLATTALGLGKARFGVEAVMNLLNIRTEDCLEKVEAIADLITGCIG